MDRKDLLKKTYVCWDEAQISQDEIEYLMSEEGLSEEDAQARVWNDPDLFSLQWDDVMDALTDLLTEFNPDGHWYCDSQNFGWRNEPIHAEFTFTTGQEFNEKVLPNTDCTFYVVKEDDHIFVQNYHHDSPMGEQYYLHPVKICDWCGTYLKPGEGVGPSGECAPCRIATDTEAA